MLTSFIIFNHTAYIQIISFAGFYVYGHSLQMQITVDGKSTTMHMSETGTCILYKGLDYKSSSSAGCISKTYYRICKLVIVLITTNF